MSITFLTRYNSSSGTTLIRVLQPVEYLNNLHVDACVHDLYSYIPKKEDLVVLHRVQADSYVVQLINYLKKIGCVICYDCDDLLFDEEGALYLSKIGKRRSDSSSAVRMAMEMSDVVTVSTKFLKRRAQRFHPNVIVMRNALSYCYFQQASAVLNEKKRNSSSLVVMAYLSGSLSHNADFQIIEGQLLQLMEENNNIKLLIVGHLDVSNRFSRFPARFEKREFIPYEKYADLFKEIDINLVPLDEGAAFCHGKSELKYVEAAACGVPSVCSKTATHCQVIKHGENGFLAADNEWFSILSGLAFDFDRRVKVGRQARLHIEENYSPEVRANDWFLLLKDLNVKFRKERGSRLSKASLILSRLRLQYSVFFRCIRCSVGRMLRLFRAA